ncbi:conserved Plasmodium protein, unknown function [Plasmodium ovale wallikeri]|uniref:Uncharacterized protein n=2 Tax=Plasmodium ovale TaxID=36330 RepID=A0A1A8YIS9_PLAOA|nr:conserved Plasmodium protein, unknown function [Plasmodium ovale wallikeri]SBT31232.1 conserved Plasmodium protein, unknown function [Plasmodium ovale wallikeri]SBT75275.1 conserved Plasmodium protein, unknown function [Plasmodium ovale]
MHSRNMIFPIVLFFAFILNKSYEKIHDIGNLPYGEKRLALNLIQVYRDVRDAEDNFFEKFENSKKILNEIKWENKNVKGNDDNASDSSAIPSSVSNPSAFSSPLLRHTTNKPISPSFVQIKSRGPVEEETIWRALYDTQLRRSPPTEQVHVFSTENVEREYEQARLHAFTSQIEMMRETFEKKLKYMGEEIPRRRRLTEVINRATLLGEQIEKTRKISDINPYQNGHMQKTYATSVVC